MVGGRNSCQPYQLGESENASFGQCWMALGHFLQLLGRMFLKSSVCLCYCLVNKFSSVLEWMSIFCAVGVYKVEKKFSSSLSYFVKKNFVFTLLCSLSCHNRIAICTLDGEIKQIFLMMV